MGRGVNIWEKRMIRICLNGIISDEWNEEKNYWESCY